MRIILTRTACNHLSSASPTKGEARIRVQMSAAHSKDQLDRAIDAVTEVARAYDVI